MYNYIQFARFAACVTTAATLIACDSANVTQRNIGLLDDFALTNCLPIEVDLSGTRLLGHVSGTDSTSIVEVAIPDGQYEIFLHYEDERHNSADAQDQPDEIWYLEGMNSSGEYALITNHTNDLPADKTSGFTNVGTYTLTGIVAVNGRHASVSPHYDSTVTKFNSIEPTLAEFVPSGTGCFDPV